MICKPNKKLRKGILENEEKKERNVQRFCVVRPWETVTAVH